MDACPRVRVSAQRHSGGAAVSLFRINFDAVQSGDKKISEHHPLP
jgi:hypothetical protein